MDKIKIEEGNQVRNTALNRSLTAVEKSNASIILSSSSSEDDNNETIDEMLLNKDGKRLFSRVSTSIRDARRRSLSIMVKNLN